MLELKWGRLTGVINDAKEILPVDARILAMHHRP